MDKNPYDILPTQSNINQYKESVDNYIKSTKYRSKINGWYLEYIDIYLNYEPNIITFHIEAVKNEKQAIELINYIKSNL